MKVEIPDSVRRQATQCPHDFRCLEAGRCGDRDMCEVVYSYGGNVMLLVSKEQVHCTYRVAYGHSQLCTCPVREYLHTQKHIRFG